MQLFQVQGLQGHPQVLPGLISGSLLKGGGWLCAGVVLAVEAVAGVLYYNKTFMKLFPVRFFSFSSKKLTGFFL